MITELQSEKCEQHKAHGFNWLKWTGHLAGKTDVHGLELGCWKGESAEWFVEHIFNGPRSTFLTIDTFEGSAEHKLAGIDCSRNYEEAIARLKRFFPTATAGIAKGESHQVLAELRANGEKYDFAYIDASHDAMNVLRDSVFVFDLIKPGGVIIWDDYEWTVMEQEIDRPRPAIDSFLKCYARRLEVIGMGWQVAVRKLA